MADISAIKALDGVTYSIKDSEARDHLVPASGTTGQVLTKTASGYGWADASGGGTVDTVNGISPDSNKNVQVDVELTQAQYDALPASKLTDDVNYFIKDGAYRPQGSVIDAEGVMYDNTESGLTSDTVQGAIDENASAIEELSAGLTNINNVLTLQRYNQNTTVNTVINFRKYGKMVTAYHFGVFSVGSANTRYTIAVIPDDYVPIIDACTACVLVNSNSITGSARILFSSSEKRVHLVSSIAGNQEYCFTISYMTP